MRVRILSPSDMATSNNHTWGDYWAKLDLEAGFSERGYEVVDSGADLDIYLFGNKSGLERMTAPLRFCWIYSHPSEVSEDITRRFDHVFVPSRTFLQKVPGSTLLYAGSAKEFVPREVEPEYDLVFLGNTAKSKRVDIVKYLVSLKKYRIALGGGGWIRELRDTPEDIFFAGDYVDNSKIGEFFNLGKLSFYSGHEDMCDEGFVAIRILDTFKSSENLCIVEENVGLSDMFRDVPTYTDKEDLDRKIEWFLSHPKELDETALMCREDVQEWTVDRTVTEIERWIKNG